MGKPSSGERNPTYMYRCAVILRNGLQSVCPAHWLRLAPVAKDTALTVCV